MQKSHKASQLKRRVRPHDVIAGSFGIMLVIGTILTARWLLANSGVLTKVFAGCVLIGLFWWIHRLEMALLANEKYQRSVFMKHIGTQATFDKAEDSPDKPNNQS